MRGALPYATAKAAIEGLTRALAVDYGPWGVRVNALALGSVGTFLFGIAALLWTLDCFVGAYITFPQSSRRSATPPLLAWLQRWLPAWLIKANKLFAFVFTWHRASGLWLWALLFVARSGLECPARGADG